MSVIIFDRHPKLRKYAVRIILWGAISSAFSYAVKFKSPWKGETVLEERPIDQQITSKSDKPVDRWWLSNAPLASINQLVNDYYGEESMPPIVTIDGFNRDRTFLPGLAAIGSSSDSPTSNLPETSPIDSKRDAERHSRNHFGNRAFVGSSDYYVSGSISGYMPESGVDLAAASFRLGIVAVPEPGSAVFLTSGALTLALARRRWSRRLLAMPAQSETTSGALP